MVADIGCDRAKWLPFVLFRIEREAPTRFSPFELLYGWQVQGPLDIVKKKGLDEVVSRNGREKNCKVHPGNEGTDRGPESKQGRIFKKHKQRRNNCTTNKPDCVSSNQDRKSHHPHH